MPRSTFYQDLLGYSVRCVEHLGSRQFFEPFFEMVHDFFGADQCMVFFLGPSSRIECLLSRDFADDAVAEYLGNAYIKEGYIADPNLASIESLSVGDTKVVHLQDMVGEMADSYRDRFFNKPGLIDKVSILTSDCAGKYYINLYRGKGRSAFREQQLFTDSGQAHLFAALITQHYRLNQSLSDEGPLAFLSDRERQVCQGILRGKKMEAISAETGIATSSGITYKKRAYAKLGITSRAALFDLCNRG